MDTTDLRGRLLLNELMLAALVLRVAETRDSPPQFVADVMRDAGIALEEALTGEGDPQRHAEIEDAALRFDGVTENLQAWMRSMGWLPKKTPDA